MTNDSFATTAIIEQRVRAAKAQRQAVLQAVRRRRAAARRASVLRITQAPPSLRQPGILLDNVALVPASLLPFKSVWQSVANRLPQGDVLLVLPLHKPQRSTFTCLADHLKDRGHAMTIMSATRFA